MISSPESESQREVAMADSRSSMRRLLGYALPHLSEFLVVVGLVLVYVVTQVMQPWLVKIVIDRDLIVKHPDFRAIVMIGILYLATTAVGLWANFTQNRKLQWFGQRIVREIRDVLYAHIESLAMRFFDTHETGRLITNVASDTNRVSQFFTSFLLSLIQDGMMLVVTMGALH